MTSPAEVTSMHGITRYGPVSGVAHPSTETSARKARLATPVTCQVRLRRALRRELRWQRRRRGRPGWRSRRRSRAVRRRATRQPPVVSPRARHRRRPAGWRRRRGRARSLRVRLVAVWPRVRPSGIAAGSSHLRPSSRGRALQPCPAHWSTRTARRLGHPAGARRHAVLVIPRPSRRPHR